MRIIFAVLLSLFSSAQANVVFYINAHPDDAELFMAKSLWTDIIASPGAHKIVVITVTAGDAGYGQGNGAGVGPIYRARETGHSSAIQFLWGLNGSVIGSKFKDAQVTVGGKRLYRGQINNSNVIWYNLRLPDGNSDGNGFSGTGYQSLAKLDNNQISTMTAINGSASYTKADLLQILREIVRIEAPGTNTVWANLPETESGNNPGDHSDHFSVSSLFQQAMADPSFSCVGKAYYSTYVNNTLAINMSQDELWIHVGMWGALNQGRNAKGQQNTWESSHNAWLGKQYITRRASDNRMCTF